MRGDTPKMKEKFFISLGFCFFVAEEFLKVWGHN